MDNKPNKPLLIYDGDCGFCLYWVTYWRSLTQDAVLFEPFQKVEHEYPEIPRENFQKAVQYVAPDRTIASGAEASFRVLSAAPYKSFWLWLYLYLPFFAPITELAYTFVSTHRNPFYRLAKMVYGREHRAARYDVLSWIYLRILGLLFLSAFVSFGTQSLGLIGHEGILPVSDLVIAANNMLDWSRYWNFPMLFWVNDSDLMVQCLPWVGAIFSCLLILNKLPRISMLMMYILYLSLVVAGQDFMAFQWDNLLLEMSLISILLLHFRPVGVWLLRFLLFRFFLAGALVKLYGGATWRALTALYEYFETQPIPTPLAWYAHHLPHAFLKMSTAAALCIELCMPFFIFLPRRLRFIACALFASLQTIILLTGNYNFFNLSTLALCFILLDDQALQRLLPQSWMLRLQQKPLAFQNSLTTKIGVCAFAVFTISLSLIQFQERFIGPAPYVLDSFNALFTPWRIVGTYGPFAVITYPRYEINVEGSMDGQTWVEYPFKYKPQDVNRPLSYIIPHQPRLDWQMWFAALGTAQQSPWFSSFIARLLENSPAVTGLLADNPFKDAAPLYVRAELYLYRFSTPEEKAATGAWWEREWINDFVAPVKRRGLFDKH